MPERLLLLLVLALLLTLFSRIKLGRLARGMIFLLKSLIAVKRSRCSAGIDFLFELFCEVCRFFTDMFHRVVVLSTVFISIFEMFS